jgi:hypothetical protein
MKPSFLMLAAMIGYVATASAADIASFRLGDNTGEDWEPAIAADGGYVYAYWPHYLATTLKDSSGATCMPYSAKGTGKNNTTSAYMYLQVSSNGGSTWGNVSIPRCPVNGNTVDAQVVVGANHRVYIANMDGNAQYTPITVSYSDDHGAHWSTPVDVTHGGRGDKDILLVDSQNNVIVAYENGGKQYVSVSTNGGASFTPKQVAAAPSGVALACGGALDTRGNAYFAWAGTNNTGKGPTTFYVMRSNDLFATYSVTTVDEGQGEPIVTSAGWDYWGGNIALGIQPKASGNDRVVVVYTAGAVAGGPERVYTKYSDTLGSTWNIPFNSSSWPNGSQLSLAPAGVWHDFPGIVGTTAAVKVIWMDNRASPGGNYTCQNSGVTGQCGIWNVYTRSSADGATNWSAEARMGQATPYRDYQSAAGFYHPYGDYSWLSTDGAGNFYAIWAEGQSYLGNGDVYYSKF